MEAQLQCHFIAEDAMYWMTAAAILLWVSLYSRTCYADLRSTTVRNSTLNPDDACSHTYFTYLLTYLLIRAYLQPLVLTDRTQLFAYASFHSVDCSIPYGSARAHVAFVIHWRVTTSFTDMLEWHLYADDTQFYDTADHSTSTHRAGACRHDINFWCKSRCLQLNASKTEAVWFSWKSNLVKLNYVDCSIQVSK